MLKRRRLRRPPLWALAATAAALCLVGGWVPATAAAQTLTRAAPVLLFLVAVTALAQLSDAAGVFDAAASRAACLARGRTWLLFLLVVAMATLTTILLSLDTTAVLLTPVVLSMCAQLGLAPLPFAMATVSLANTASLLLPVSNLTNLLAIGPLGLSSGAYVARMWPSALTAVVVTAALLLLLYGNQLRGRYPLPTAPEVADRVLFWCCIGAVGAFAVLILGGVDVTVAALGCAGIALVAFLLRRRDLLRWTLIPWRLVLLVGALFVLVEGARGLGLDDVLTAAAGTGTGPTELLRLAGTAAVGANIINNLPAYLALEPVTDGSADRLLAVLIGVNTGPVICMWGSLATLLWLEQCRARGVKVSARSFAGVGLLLTPVVVLTATTALVLS